MVGHVGCTRGAGERCLNLRDVQPKGLCGLFIGTVWYGKVLPVPCTMVTNVPKGAQCRAWCVTLWSEEDVGRLKSVPGIQALVVGKEVAPSTGRVHYQSYVRFENNKRFSWWKNQFPEAHVEPRKGTEAQAALYCRKEGNVLIDFGCQVEVESSGSVEDHILDMLEAGAPLFQVYRAHRLYFFRNSRRITDMEALMRSWRENGEVFGRNI